MLRVAGWDKAAESYALRPRSDSPDQRFGRRGRFPGLRLDPTRANKLTNPATRYVHYNIPFFAFSEYRVRLGKVVGMGLRVRGGHQFHRHNMEANNMDFFAARGGLLAGADLRISWENRKFLPYLTLGYSHMRYRQAYNLTAFPGGRASGFTASLHAFQEDIRLAIGLSL
ncbi:MAG: hypothetical protein WA952_15625 [Lewinella sp.]